MSRVVVIATVLAAFAAGGALSMRAFAGPSDGAANATIRLAATPKPATAASQWQPGLNYTVLGYPQPPSVPKGKVEVNEVFWYGCSHCYALDPVLESWKKNKPEFVEFVRIPVIWGMSQRQHAKLFYTLQK